MKSQVIDRPLVFKKVDKGIGTPNVRIGDDGLLHIAVSDGKSETQVARKIAEEVSSAKFKELKEVVDSLSSFLNLKEAEFKSNRIEEAKSVAEEMVSKISVSLQSRINSVIDEAIAATDRGIEDGLKKRKAIFSKGKWHGDDIGSMNEPVNDFYSKGEAKGLRLENKKDLPEGSAKNVGRVVFETDEQALYVDCGNEWKRLSANKFEIDVQIQEAKLPISIEIEGAQDMIFQVMDASNDFLRMNAKITTPSSNKLVVELPEGSAVGTYRILGVK